MGSIHSQDVMFFSWCALIIAGGIIHFGWKTRCRAQCGKWFSEKRLGKVEVKPAQIETKDFIRKEEIAGKTVTMEHEDHHGRRSTSYAREGKYRNVKYKGMTTTKYPGFLCGCKRGTCKGQWTLDLPPERTYEEERLGIES